MEIQLSNVRALKCGGAGSNWKSGYVASGDMALVLVATDQCRFGK